MRTWMLRVCRPSARRGGVVLGAAVLLACVTCCASVAADAVMVADSKKREPTRRSGQITDYAGGQLTLELPSGRLEKIAADQVVSIETRLVPAHENADRAAAEGHEAQALNMYRRALRDETRPWMQQRILADIARCYHLLGQVGRACEHFMVLVASDPQTPWFDRIPLSWSAQQIPSDVADQARQWLRQADQPIATLIGASWLLSGADREAAIQALQRLTRNDDRRIASLAEAQLWRIRVTEASSDTVAQWTARVMAMPPSLRAGPCFVVGTALAHRQQHQRAALMLLRLPILYPRHRNLAAESLWAAGEALDQAGQPAEARNLFRELRQNYPQDPLSQSAEQRLRELSDQARSATATGAPE